MHCERRAECVIVRSASTLSRRQFPEELVRPFLGETRVIIENSKRGIVSRDLYSMFVLKGVSETVENLGNLGREPLEGRNTVNLAFYGIAYIMANWRDALAKSRIIYRDYEQCNK